MDSYPHIATERFDKANIWIAYILSQLKKYLKGNTLEVGAGCGSFSRGYIEKKSTKVTLTDNDDRNINDLKKKFAHYRNVKITKKEIKEFNESFDTIIYFNVLEHIKDDDSEIKLSISKLNLGGYLIILVPAHQHLYGKLDKAVGHYRRYNIKYFEKKFKGVEKISIKHLDSMGYFLYFLNKLFFKNEVYPTKIKIFIWDKIFTPITIIADFFLRYKLGKNILCIYKRTE